MGAAGGATIIYSLLQITFNIVDHGMTIQQAINAPRISSRNTGSVSCETGPFFPLPFTPTPPFSTAVVDALRSMGHDIPPCDANIATGASSSAQAVIIDLQTGSSMARRIRDAKAPSSACRRHDREDNDEACKFERQGIERGLGYCVCCVPISSCDADESLVVRA
jgi:hypothetical protein